MASTSVIKSVPSQHDLLSDLHTFVAGASRGAKSNPLEFTRTALNLLKSLPAARDAVLEYFCTLFDAAVEKHLADIDLQNQQSNNGELSPEESAITEIHNVLCNFVTVNAETWAPVISKWSLELLGTLSSRYVGRAHIVPNAELKGSLQLWMSCRATRTLIDITTQCLSCLMHSDTDACINALLETSITHSPNFDWVVAHVGSCFPQTVITKVLSCGLKDFCQLGTVKQWADTPKLNSVVGILGHLAGSHYADIQMALLTLLKSSFVSMSVEAKATVPFLLHLSSVSPMLLRAFTAGALQTFTVSMLPQFMSYVPEWCAIFGNPEALKELVVHLILGCDENAVSLLKLLLDAAILQDKNLFIVNTIARELLEMMLQEIDRQLRSIQPVNIPILDTAKHDIHSLLPFLVKQNTLEVIVSVRFASLIARQSQGVLVTCGSYMLVEATTDNHLAAFVRLSTGELYQSKPSTLKHILEQATRNALSSTTATEHLWNNVATLLKWEKMGHAPSLHGHLVSEAVVENLREASRTLSNSSSSPAAAHAVAIALDLAVKRAKHRASLELMQHLSRSVVQYFFFCLTEENLLFKLRGCRACCRLLTHLAVNASDIRALAIRELLEGALFHDHARLFGTKHVRPAVARRLSTESSLQQENQKWIGSSVLAQRHSQVFHSGIIGNGLRVQESLDIPSEENVKQNVQFLLDAIRAVCANNSGGVSLDAMTSVSLMLVELISPDVMYNGLPWPEEEFCKVTIERDLFVRRRMDELPVIWDLLSLVAAHRPTLCYCSVLLRAVTATLIAQWGATRQHESHRVTTVKLLELLALGQLLPPPLSSLGDIIKNLNPQEVVRLLRECVWNYLRDNVPSPAMFDSNVWRDPGSSRPASNYVEPLRQVLMADLARHGGIYARLFLPVPS